MSWPYPPPAYREEVQRFLEARGVRHTRVLAAVSGGADSTFLLWMLDHLTRVLDLELYLVYVNHGPGREEEERHVRAVAQDLGWPLRVYRYRGPTPDRNREAFWRRLRMRAFRRALYQTRARWLMTGHQGTDVLETLLMQWIRGSGLRGLRALLPQRGRILRPLIGFTREEIRRALQEAGLTFHEDPANQDPSYERVWIRQTWLPRFRALRPGAERQALRVLRYLDEVYRSLLWAGERLWIRSLRAVFPAGVVLDRTVWTRYDREAWVERLRLRFPRLRARETSRLWRWMLEGGEGAFEGGYCVADAREVFLGWERPSFPVLVLHPGEQTVPSWDLKVVLASGALPPGVPGTGLPREGEVRVRPVQRQERVGGKRVEDWFRRWRLPRWKRKIWPVVEVEGVPVWMPGLPPLAEDHRHMRLETKEWKGYALLDPA
ncbi:MAG: tRNA lysidine(34) synthetase TilS [Candidatus Hydrothermae bacterium]|nr:tRNA lysidine(34) synthetase TilS [Candidatus Hydrothermae bacterium]